MTYISQSSYFALYLDEYLKYKHHTYDLTFDLKINVDDSDLYSMLQQFLP